MSETLRVESPDVFAVMETTFRSSREGVHAVLTVALLAACAANLLLACSWL